MAVIRGVSLNSIMLHTTRNGPTSVFCKTMNSTVASKAIIDGMIEMTVQDGTWPDTKIR